MIEATARRCPDALGSLDSITPAQIEMEGRARADCELDLRAASKP